MDTIESLREQMEAEIKPLANMAADIESRQATIVGLGGPFGMCYEFPSWNVDDRLMHGATLNAISRIKRAFTKRIAEVHPENR